MRRAVAALVALGMVVGLLGTAMVGSAMAMFGIDGQPAATSAATAKVPPAMLSLYQEAAATCRGLPWTILAAIGTVESDNGQSTLPGVHSGANAAGAEGPMQFEWPPLPPTTSPSLPVARHRRIPTTRPTPSSPRPACCAPTAPPAAPTSPAPSTPTTTRRRTWPRCSRWPSRTPRHRPGDGTAVSDTGAGAVAVSWALVADRHALRLGRRDPGRRLRLLGPRPGRLHRGRASPCPGSRRTSTTPRPSWPRAQPLAPGDLVFFGSGTSRSTMSACSWARWTARRHGRRALHGRQSAGRGVPRHAGASFGSLRFVGATRP